MTREEIPEIKEDSNAETEERKVSKVGKKWKKRARDTKGSTHNEKNSILVKRTIQNRIEGEQSKQFESSKSPQ